MSTALAGCALTLSACSEEDPAATSTSGATSDGGTDTTGGTTMSGTMGNTVNTVNTVSTVTTTTTTTGSTTGSATTGGTTGGTMGGAGGMGNTTETATTEGGTSDGGTTGGDDINSGPDTMGWIGCSMGENTAAGYRRIGGTRMWGAYGNGGAVAQNWTNNTGPAASGFRSRSA